MPAPVNKLSIAAGLLLVTQFICVPGDAVEPPANPATPQEVWAGYDPTTEPLEIEVLKTWTEGKLDYREFNFTGLTHDKTKVRVYAIACVPQGGEKCPGVLHIHGGGQSVAQVWLKYWGERGYAALTFDHGGKRPGREKFTDWGELTQGNQAEAGKLLLATEPSVRHSSWYLWARVCRRAITALAAQERVDPQRLGIFGVSVGGTLVWPVAAMDDRVKAACAIYGVGQNTYPQDSRESDLAVDRAETRLWRTAMEAEAYAPLVRCPLLFLNGSNDHHGPMDRSFLTLERVKSPLRWAYSPRWRHHILWEQGQDLGLWMDSWLKSGAAFPSSPRSELKLSTDGVPELRIEPAEADEIAKVEAFYAVSVTNPVHRFWRSAQLVRHGTVWTAALPVLDVAEPLYAWGNVYYRSGVCLSTRLHTVLPRELGPAQATDRPSNVIDDFKDGIGAWVTHSPATDPLPPLPMLLKQREGPGGKAGVSVTHPIGLFTHKIGDPKWHGPTDAVLRLQVLATAPKELTLTLYEKEFAVGQRAFAWTAKLEPSAEWQTFTLRAADFRDERDAALTDWSELKMLELRTKSSPGDEPLYGDFRWVQKQAE